MSSSLAARIHDELKKTVLIDPHSHINPHSPASQTLADLLGYHYYTELAHSSGMPRELIEPTAADGNPEPALGTREKVSRLMEHLGAIDNTVQWSWMLELCRELFDWHEDRIDQSNWEGLYDRAEKVCQAADWEDQVLQRSGVESIFLTNDFDDPLHGFDLKRYIPCLRTDDLVFHREHRQHDDVVVQRPLSLHPPPRPQHRAGRAVLDPLLLERGQRLHRRAAAGTRSA